MVPSPDVRALDANTWGRNAVLVLLTVGAALAACDSPVPCAGACSGAAPMIVYVVDRDDGTAIASTVNGFPCDPRGCRPRQADGGTISGAGTYALDIESDGYRSDQREVTVPAATPSACCDIDFEPQRVVVPLLAL